MVRTGPPRGRSRPHTVPQLVVARPVACHDSQLSSVQVRDAESVRRPARGVHRAGARERPADLALRIGIDRGHTVIPGDDDVLRLRRPGPLRPGHELARRAVGADEPRPGPRVDQEQARRRQRGQCGLSLHLLTGADRVPNGADERAAGRRDGCGQDENGDGRRQERAKVSLGPGDRLARVQGSSHERPGPPLCVELVRRLDALERAPYFGVAAHACSRSMISSRRSRPRRRRELTVPRGRLRSSAISPGV